MFGYVTANYRELTPEQRSRYGSVYCGICRQIHTRSDGLSRLALSYDMAFLALLLMSLYEPEEQMGKSVCLPHPLKRRPWVDNSYIRYAADMNVLLAYFNALDDWQDDRKPGAKLLCAALGRHCGRIREEHPRQYAAVQTCMERLGQLEREACANPDEPAGAFGELMAELFDVHEDHWSACLRQLGNALGRFVYLMDAGADYDRDLRRGSYNPYIAMGQGKQPDRWREYLILILGRCAGAYEHLPLVQDKALLDNILYSGVWVQGKPGKRRAQTNDSGSV